jgi:superfamily II DNA or RNA helicase
LSLKSFPLLTGYSSIANDPYHEFFVPCFLNSNIYCRYGGFFTSKNLALCAEGIAEFLNNDGTMQLVLSPLFTKDDVDAIKKGITNKEEKIKDNWIKSYDKLKEKFDKDHVRALSWMLSQDPPKLEIKLVIYKDSQGNIIDNETLKNSGKADLSIGIFQDEEGNSISFNGIIKPSLNNEDEYTDIIVHKNWIHKEHVDSDFKKFMNYWDTSDIFELEKDNQEFEIIDLPKMLKEKFLELKPESIDELDLKYIPKLRRYQQNARNSWIKHGHRGIFEMATGTGKTFTAIGCLKEIQKKNSEMFVVITCPTQNLVSQWHKELKKWGFDAMTTLKGKKDWKPKLTKILNNYNYGITTDDGITIVVTTYVTFSNNEFIELVENNLKLTVLIADEMHTAGAPMIQNAMLPKYKYRLGLSATPQRYFDDEGSQFLIDYFKPTEKCNNCHDASTIFKMDIEDAINEKILVQYDYYPHYVALTEDELMEYKVITHKLQPELHKKPQDQNKTVLTILLNQRANIIKNAEHKIDAFQEIINENKKLKYALVYCAPSKTDNQLSQMNRVQTILNNVPITNSIIKSDLTNLKEREKILENIQSGILNCVLAINILDEGIDIPPLQTAIILASTGNPKQFVQRRGRILRSWSGTYSNGTRKKHAIIHDVFVIPYLNQTIEEEYKESEKNIVRKELLRHLKMSEISRNPNYGIEQINKIKKEYGIME